MRAQAMSVAVFVGLVACACGSRAEPLPDLGAIPDFELVTQTGAPYRRADLAGHVVVTDFVFTRCPTVCPMMTERMKALHGALGARLGDVRLVSFSVDPDRDTPEVMTAYMRERGLDPARWTFVTGRTEEVARMVVGGFRLTLGERTPVQGGEPGAYDILHDTHFVLLDRAAHVRGYYTSDEEGTARLLGDVERLLAEAAP